MYSPRVRCRIAQWAERRDRKAKLTRVRFPGFLPKSSFIADSSTVLVRQTLCASITGGSDKHIFVATNTFLSRQTRVCRDKNDACVSSRKWYASASVKSQTTGSRYGTSIVSTRQHCAHWQEWVALRLGCFRATWIPCKVLSFFFFLFFFCIRKKVGFQKIRVTLIDGVLYFTKSRHCSLVAETVLLSCCLTSTEARWPIRDGDRVGRGREW